MGCASNRAGEIEGRREKKDVVDRLLSIVASNTLSNESEQSLYDKGMIEKVLNNIIVLEI